MITYKAINEAGNRLVRRLKAANLQFNGEAIVFVGALGICVRKILPLAVDKHTDPAVVCVDSTGKYAIPVLSGHVGGANKLAWMIAQAINAQAVITTQSDNSGLWALDTIADDYGWIQKTYVPEDFEYGSGKYMNCCISSFVNGEPTAVVIETKDEGTDFLETSYPEHATLFYSYEEFLDKKDKFGLLILVSSRHIDVNAFEASQLRVIQYCPKSLHLGIGCQSGTPIEAAQQIIEEIRQKGFSKESIATVATIELKKDEPLLKELQNMLPQAKTVIFTAAELADIKVPNPSDKVKEVTGCYGVAEAAAMASAKSERLEVEKQKGNVTSATHPLHYTWALADDRKDACKHDDDDGCHTSEHGHIEIVGAGPGDPDLVSVRGRRFLEQADLILYAGSLVPRELTFCAKQGATVRSSAELNLEEQFLLMKEFYDRGKLVVRLHTGDPCIYGAIQEQMAFFDKYAMEYHITPGISSFLAAAAELKSQFTIPEKCQTIILTRGEGRTPMPDKEKLHLLAQHQSTMCIFLSASIVDEVMSQLLEGGYPPETPVAACYRLTWKDQRIYRGQLKDLAHILKSNNLTLTTMIVVGDAIDNRHGLSKLYDSHFTHLFRKGKE